MAVQPTHALANALRELAQAAYGNPNAKWENPQALVRDALRAARSSTLTTDSVGAALAWHNSQDEIMLVTPTIAPEHQEVAVDRWMLGLLSAALGAQPNLDPNQPLLPGEFEIETHSSNKGGTQFSTFVLRRGEEKICSTTVEVSAGASAEDKKVGQAATVLATIGYIADEAAQNREWKRLVETIFGDAAKPYLERMA